MSDITPFSTLNLVIGSCFYKPDLQAVRILLGVAKTHYLHKGSTPVWMFLVGPPGTGKTAMNILCAKALYSVVTISSVTEKTFLSGYIDHPCPGLLEKLGRRYIKDGIIYYDGDAIFLIKDFTTILSMRSEKKTEIITQLREVHDGEWKITTGTGETKVWRGKVTCIAAVTLELDRHYSVLTNMGDRFLQLRIHRQGLGVVPVAMDLEFMERQFEEAAHEAVAEIFQNSTDRIPRIREEDMIRIDALADLVAISRTKIHRERITRQLDDVVPEAESGSRIGRQLGKLAQGIAALKNQYFVEEDDIQDIFRVGLDSIPEAKRLVLKSTFLNEEPERPMNPTIKSRTLEDLRELGIMTGYNSLTEYGLNLAKLIRMKKNAN